MKQQSKNEMETTDTSKDVNPDTANAINSVLGSDNSLETVRDILFGAQIRESDERRSELESRLSESLSQLKSEMLNIQAEMQKNLQAAQKKIDEQTKKNQERMREEFKEVKASIQALDKDTSQTEAELADQIVAEGKRLDNSIETLNNEMSAQLEYIFNQLNDEKTDRFKLADLLENVAGQLKQPSTDSDE